MNVLTNYSRDSDLQLRNPSRLPPWYLLSIFYSKTPLSFYLPKFGPISLTPSSSTKLCGLIAWVEQDPLCSALNIYL